MRLRFLGGTGTVTGSKYLLEASSRKILVDCGLFQGFKQLRLRNWGPLPVDPATIDSVVLTHAHLDHSGYLPVLVKSGFKGRVRCTPATRDLCEILLLDSARLQVEEADYANRKGFSKHSPALPLYTERDALDALKRFETVDFEEPFDLGGGLSFTFHRNGHILGSACARFEQKVGRARQSILFSGDLGRPADPVMLPPAPVPAADTIVIESTYGDRAHEAEDPIESLSRIVNRAVSRKSVVLVPAFAVGRTQTLLRFLHVLTATGKIPRIPIFLDSPMATDANEVFRKYPSEHRIKGAERHRMLEVAEITRSVEESKAILRRHGPMIVIAGSGMATGGRILHHLARFAPDPNNVLLFTGFQAGGTRGADIVGGAKSVKIHGEFVPIRCEVQLLGNLSAHADQGELLDWLEGLPSAPKRVFVTHGEPAASDVLRKRIEEELGWCCRVPEYLQAESLE